MEGIWSSCGSRTVAWRKISRIAELQNATEYRFAAYSKILLLELIINEPLHDKKMHWLPKRRDQKQIYIQKKHKTEGQCN